MTFGSVMGVLLTLGFVLALLGIALKLLRRFAPTSATNARLRMEVVQRLALGPKQGIAVVRVGERFVAISVGEGGINRLFELEATEIAEAEQAARQTTAPVRAGGLDFRAALTGALKTAGLATLVAVALGTTTRPAAAQTGRPAPQRTAATPAAAVTTTSSKTSRTSATSATTAPSAAPSLIDSPYPNSLRRWICALVMAKDFA